MQIGNLRKSFLRPPTLLPELAHVLAKRPPPSEVLHAPDDLGLDFGSLHTLNGHTLDGITRGTIGSFTNVDRGRSAALGDRRPT